MRPVQDRFWSKVDKTDTCWLWTRAKNNRGYGLFRIGSRPGKLYLVHRLAYEWLVGPIPDGMTIDHVWKKGCRSSLCVNPEHLEAVSKSENNHRKKDKSVTCSGGHIYDWIYIRSNGWRERRCSTCNGKPYGNYELIG